MSEIRFAGAGNRRVSYQVRGQGPPDLVLAFGGPVSGEETADTPAAQRLYHRLASFSRLLTLDFRGIGLSDPIDEHTPALESMAADLLSVLDDIGSKSSAIFALDHAVPAAIHLAVHHPERISSLVLMHPSVCTLSSPDFPWGIQLEDWEEFGRSLAEGRFSKSNLFAHVAPSAAGNADVLGSLDRMHRRAGSPSSVMRFVASLSGLDVRNLLGRVRVPTLVVHRRDNPLIPLEHGRFVAREIPGAVLRELSGADHVPFLGDNSDTVFEVVQEFLVGTRGADPDRFVTTLLFTDIVGSTALASSLGDRRWQDVLDAHDRISTSEIRRHAGRLVKRTGDGILATFEGPAPAIDCAKAIAAQAPPYGFEIRAAVHICEVERRGDDIGGLGVHLASRILAFAEAGEILVSPAVPVVMAGSAHKFVARGRRRLKGVDDEWDVFAVDMQQVARSSS